MRDFLTWKSTPQGKSPWRYNCGNKTKVGGTQKGKKGSEGAQRFFFTPTFGQNYQQLTLCVSTTTTTTTKVINQNVIQSKHAAAAAAALSLLPYG